MALQFTSTNRDRISILVYGQAYSSLSATQKLLVDNNNSSAVPTSTPSGMAGDAFRLLGNMAQYLNQSGTTTIPDEWETWFVSETQVMLEQNARPERVDLVRKIRDQIREDALDAFTRKAVTYAEGSDSEAYYLSVTNIRRFVINQCVRGKPRVFPAVEDIDAAMYRALNSIWNRKYWRFRRRLVTMTISTSETVTYDLPSGEVFDSSATRQWYYDDTNTNGNIALNYVDADEMARFRANTSIDDARPRFYRVEERGASKTYYFHPVPDQQYTVKGEVFIKGPALVSSGAADVSTYLSRIPQEMAPVIKKAALAELLKNYGQERFQSLESDVEDEINRLAPLYEDSGLSSQMSEAVRDAYYDHMWQRGGGWEGAAML